MSLRQLKYHEKKLLRKVDFLWQKEDNLRFFSFFRRLIFSFFSFFFSFEKKKTKNNREIKIMRRYQIRNREEYIKYQKMSGQILKLAHKLKRLPAEDKFRNQVFFFLLLSFLLLSSFLLLHFFFLIQLFSHIEFL